MHNPHFTTAQRVRLYDQVTPLIHAMEQSTALLVKTRTSVPVADKTVRMANALLRRVREVVAGEIGARHLVLVRRGADAAEFAMVLDQACALLRNFRHRYYGWDDLSEDVGWRTGP